MQGEELCFPPGIPLCELSLCRKSEKRPVKTSNWKDLRKYSHMDEAYMKNNGNVVNEWNFQADKFLNTR